jgi:hypothetical protein
MLLGGIDLPDAADLIARVTKALDARTAPHYVALLLSQPDWRLHLIAAVAHLLDERGKLGRDPLWRTIDAGSWVTPQLVATASLRDGQFDMNARARVEPGRAPKLVASILGVSAMSPVLKELEPVWRGDAQFAELLQQDRDRADLVASAWRASAQRLLR